MVSLDSLDMSRLLEYAESLLDRLERYQQHATASQFRVNTSVSQAWLACDMAAHQAESEFDRLGLPLDADQLAAEGPRELFAVLALRNWLIAMEQVWASVPVGTHVLQNLAQALAELREIVADLRSAIMPADPQAELSDRHRDILQVLFEQEAFDADHRLTTAEVADAVCGKGRGNPETFKVPITDLKRRKLIRTKEGRGGGVWLTPEGKAHIKQARKL